MTSRLFAARIWKNKARRLLSKLLIAFELVGELLTYAQHKSESLCSARAVYAVSGSWLNELAPGKQIAAINAKLGLKAIEERTC